MQKALLVAVGLATIALAAVPLAVLPGLGRFAPANLVFFVLLLLGLTIHWGLGSIIVVRASGNAVGWLVAAAAVLVAASFACYALGVRLIAPNAAAPLGAWMLLAGAALFIPALCLPGAIFIAFPSGTLPGPRWRWPVAATGAMLGAGVLGLVARPGPIGDGLPVNPAATWFRAVPADLLDGLDALGQLSLALGAGLGVLAIAVRSRRAGRVERQQLLIFFAAAIPAAITLTLDLVGTPGGLAANLGRIRSAAGARPADILAVVSLTLFNLAVAVGILRYRLYDIDRIISRTLSWAAVTGVLAACFAGAVIALQSLLSGLTQGETLSVAGSTLVAFALFQPVRRRVQGLVDRRFNRAQYDAERLISAFAERLRDQVDLPTLADELDVTVRRSMATATVDLWLRGGGR